MPFWMWVSEYSGQGRGVLVAVLVALCLVLPQAGTAAETWLWQPWMSMSAGHETDLILDPDLTRTVVPGGSFMEMAPGFRLSRRLSATASFRLLNRTTWERFANDDNRSLFGSQLFGEFRFKGKSPLYGRAALSGDYFNDSGAASFRRYSGGGEVGLGVESRHWSLELSGFLQGRTYPNVGVTLNSGAVASYNETHRGVGGLVTWHPVRSLFLRGQVSGRNTDALDPQFESTSLTTIGSVEFRLSPRAWASANVTSQSRNFENRTASTDHDSYYQYGAGLGYRVTPQISLTGRYAFAEYTYPQGQVEDTERFSLAAIWQFGRRSRPISRHRIPAAVNSLPQSGRHSPVLLRIHAPQARQVTVAGTFNNWQGAAHPMRKVDNGWWELQLQLLPGSYQYVYVVDGAAVAPPDAVRTVADGFGGNNGILEIIR